MYAYNMPIFNIMANKRNVNLSLRLIKLHSMKTYGESEV
jgi:hypothetical protein